MSTQITLTLPDNISLGDLITVRGAIFDASTTFVDWEALHRGEPNAIDLPGELLLRIAAELQKQERTTVSRDEASVVR